VAEIGSINVAVRDVLSLRVGDVVRLSDVHIKDPIVLTVGSKRKFFCQPGKVGRKMAVQIIGKIDADDVEEFEEIDVEGDELYE
jgi:flagellar motor switch protein FliM